MDKLELGALRAIQQHQMLKNGDTVIVALSGGADSVALFHFLYLHQEALGVAVQAAHVNHGLRPTAAQDAAFVRTLCAQYGVPLHETRLHPPAEGAGEEWARQQRYAFLRQVAAPCKAVIATAHTRTDNAETVLLNLARGAGVRGAAGIPPVRQGIVRPLLMVSRAQVEAYLAAHGLPHVEDETNATDVYARNRVRHTLLPALEQVHPGAEAALARFADAMAETAAYLDEQAAALLQAAALDAGAKEWRADCAARPNDAMDARGAAPWATWDAAVLAHAPAPVAKAALARVIARYAKQEKTALTDAVYGAVQAGHGAHTLGANVVLAVAQGHLRAQPPRPCAQLWTAPFAPGEQALPGGKRLRVVHAPWPQNEQFINSGKDEKKLLKFWADCDRIQGNPRFRTRRPGDRFAVAGRGVTKSLHKLFSEEKIPPAQRETLLVLATGSTVLWAEGFGFAEGLGVTRDTKWAVAVQMQPPMEE